VPNVSSAGVPGDLRQAITHDGGLLIQGPEGTMVSLTFPDTYWWGDDGPIDQRLLFVEHENRQYVSGTPLGRAISRDKVQWVAARAPAQVCAGLWLPPEFHMLHHAALSGPFYKLSNYPDFLASVLQLLDRRIRHVLSYSKYHTKTGIERSRKFDFLHTYNCW